MICRGCNRKIEDDSIFCRWCGARVARSRREKKTAAPRYPKARKKADGTFAGQLMLGGERLTVTADSMDLYRAKVDALRAGLIGAKKHEALTLGEAIDRYLADSKNRLSPSTMRSYQSIRKNQLQDIMGWNIFSCELNFQGAIDAALADYSPKTVKNVWGLCRASIRHAGGAVQLVKMPPKIQKEHAYLDYKDIKVFLAAVRGHKVEMAALLALHSLRLSEILALKGSSVAGDVIRVRGAVVEGPDGLVYREANKTSRSRRDVPVMIPRLKELLKGADPDAALVTYSEHYLYDNINAICEGAGLPAVGVHGLRHSMASLAYHLGWKEMSTQQVGGWKNSTVVHEIYTHNADLENDVKTMQNYFSIT